MLMKNSISRLIIGTVQHMPLQLIQLAYKVPFLANLASKLLKHSSSDEPTIVTVRQGPLAGRKLWINGTTPHYYWIKGHDEPAVLAALQMLVRPGYHVVDIGSHVGTETLLFSQWVGSGGKVTSIEPDPINFKMLTANVGVNGLSNVQLVNAAIYGESGLFEFINGKGVCSRMVDNRAASINGPGTISSMQTHTLDELFADKQPAVDLVKIDVEDSEVEVLRGATGLLREQQPFVVVELHSFQSAKGCAKLLLNAGYQLELIGNHHTGFESYLETQPQVDYAHGFARCHLLARPARKHI
jgi:FkbM family methyltransferase